MYLETSTDIIRLADNSHIPFDENNGDYQAYLAWVAAGNIPQDNFLSDAQTSQIAVIEAAFNNSIVQTIDYLGHTFQCDLAGQERMKAVASSGSVPAGFAWYDINNNPVSMTFADLQTFIALQVQRGFSAYVKKQDLKAQIRAATTVSAVMAIVWS